MNTFMKGNSFVSRPGLLGGVLVAGLLTVGGSGFAQSSRDAKPAPSQKLVVNVVDLTGLADIETDFVRENILESAFHHAADDKEWLGKVDFRYNAGVPDDRGAMLEFTLVNWERSPANFYRATVTARYRTAGGETLNLGSFDGNLSGITVTTGWDINDHFMKAAQQAFDQALDKLAEERGLT